MAENKNEKDSPTVSMLGEFELIDRLVSHSKRQFPKEFVGPGDDCAVITLDDTKLLITSDLLVENRHFRLSYFPPYMLGWKTLAVSLSDIAAMGGRPIAATINLQLRPDLPVLFLDEFYRGLYELSEATGTVISGGDTTASQELAFTSTVLGICHQAPVLRSGARPGDDIWVSGVIGRSGIGLRLMEEKISTELVKEGSRAEFEEAFFQPRPRLELGKTLAENRLATAMIDVSDGLFQDTWQLSRASQKNKSKLIFEIFEDKIPIHADVKTFGIAAVEAGTFGEDYELLFTSPKELRNQVEKLIINAPGDNDMLLTRIGAVRETRGVEVPGVYLSPTLGGSQMLLDIALSLRGLKSAGFSHF